MRGMVKPRLRGGALGLVLIAFGACGGQSADRRSPGAAEAGRGGLAESEAGSPSNGGSGTTASGSGSGGASTSGGAGRGGQPSSEEGGGDGGADAPAGAGGSDGGSAPSCDEQGACEDALALSADSKSCPTAAITLTTSSTYFVGGVDRWVLQFDWSCSDLTALGEPSRAALQLRLQHPLSPPLDEIERTFSYPTPASETSQYLHGRAEIWIRGSGVPEIQSTLTPLESVLTIRRVNDKLIGSVRLAGATSTGAPTIMQGPFEVAVPVP